MHVHNIDFHYHAGQERQTGKSLEDYLLHARMTGRRVLGITDHLGFFVKGPSASDTDKQWIYERSLEGLSRYRREVEELRGAFGEMELYFGPEVPPKMAMGEVPDHVVAMSDFFIVEVPFAESTEQHTENFVARIEQIARFVAATNKPTYIAHPFRMPVNHRLTKRDIEPWITAIEPRRGRDFDVERLNEFFLLDLPAVGRAAGRAGVPLEINGNTQARVRASNLPAALQMLWKAFGVLEEHGTRFVPGSDQHGFASGTGRMGGAVPADCFEYLGVEVEDIAFLPQVRGRAVAMESA